MSWRRQAAALVSVMPACLHILYGVAGGIHPEPGVRWLLVAATVVGSALVWYAYGSDRWAVAWVGLGFIVAPAVPDWPAIGVSVGGLLALFLMAVTAVAVLVASFPRRPKSTVVGVV